MVRYCVTSSFPAHERSPFYDPSGEPIPPPGKIYLERVQLRDTSCDEPDNTNEDDLNLNHHGKILDDKN